MVILETDRLILCHLQPEHIEPLFTLYRDPEIRRYFPDGTLTRDETQREIEWFANGHPEYPTLGLWATLERQTGAFPGRCGLLPWTIDGRHEVELAYLIDKARWRQGFATEAASAIVQYAAERLGLRRLICLIAPGNDASVRWPSRWECSLNVNIQMSWVQATSMAGPSELTDPGRDGLQTWQFARASGKCPA